MTTTTTTTAAAAAYARVGGTGYLQNCSFWYWVYAYCVYSLPETVTYVPDQWWQCVGVSATAVPLGSSEQCCLCHYGVRCIGSIV